MVKMSAKLQDLSLFPLQAGLRRGDLVTHVNSEPVASLCHTEVVRLIVAGGRRLTLNALPLEKTYIRSDRRRRPPGKMAPTSKRTSSGCGHHRTRHGSSKSTSGAGGSGSGGNGSGSGAASPAVQVTGKKSLFRKLSERRRVDLVQLWQQQQTGEGPSGPASACSSGPTSPSAVLRPRPTSLYSPRSGPAPASTPSPQASPGHHQQAPGPQPPAQPGGSSRRKSMHLLSSTQPVPIGRSPSPLTLTLSGSGPSPPPHQGGRAKPPK